MASHTQATPIPSVDNEPHHDDGEIVPDFPTFFARRVARYAAAAHDHDHNDDLAIDETRPRALGSPFRTPPPSSSRGSTSTKRSHASMEDDDGSTPVPARPHQRVRHNSHSPTPQLQEDHDFHADWQAAPLAPVRQQPPGIEYAARNVLPFNGFLQQSGLNREALERGAQVAAPPDHHRLRRMTFDFAVPAPRDREHRRLPSPRPGPEHFAGEFAAAAAPPSPPPAAAAPENLFAPRPLPPALLHHVLLRPRSPPALFPPPPPPAPEQVPAIFDPEQPVVGYYQQAGYYHLGQRIFQPAPPPRRWLDWPDMSAGHREAWIAVEEWEDSARELMGRLDGMIERGWGWIEGIRG
jgi:hypothetical protein